VGNQTSLCALKSLSPIFSRRSGMVKEAVNQGDD
jgi:hypothetical protein